MPETAGREGRKSASTVEESLTQGLVEFGDPEVSLPKPSVICMPSHSSPSE